METQTPNTPSDSQENPGSPTPVLSLANILAIPTIDNKVVKVTREFTFGGQTYALSCNKNAFADADDFYLMSQAMAAGAEGFQPYVVTLPDSTEVVIKSRILFSSLQMLASAIVEPPFSVDEWCIVVKKIGLGIEDIIEWVADTTDMKGSSVSRDKEKAGKGENATP